MQLFVERSQPYQIPGYPDWLSSLLHARGLHTKEQAAKFLAPSLDQLHPPTALPGMAKAVDMIKALSKKKARAVVYGDYDVDGLCASVIAKEALKAVGLKAIIYIPDRHSEGYGLHGAAVRELAGQAELLLTVDCGITAVEEVALAKELGMQVIITDHHQPPDILPPADALVNPMLGGYPFPSLCGAGLAWKLSWALMGADFAIKQLDLAALATIADLVPLLQENRVIAALGLERLQHTHRLGLQALMASMGLEPGQAVSSERVGFGLAPRLNAGGRLTTAQAALQLLETTRQEEAQQLAGELNLLNQQRQAQQAEVTQQAEAMLADIDLLHSHSIVVWGEGWGTGVVGLAAGRLAEKYGFPSVVLSCQDGVCQGSARSAAGVDLYAALLSCADLFERFGGHKAAAGLSLRAEQLPLFKQRFEMAVRGQLDGRTLLKEVGYDAELSLDQVTVQAVQQLELLRPFGMDNPAPAFLLKNVEARGARRVGQSGQHLKLSLAKGSDLRDAIGFGFGEQHQALPPSLDAVVQLSLNSFQGRVTAQCQLNALRAGEQAFSLAPQDELTGLLQDMAAAVSNDKVADQPALPMGEVSGYRGSLLVCRSWQTAEAMHQRYPHFATAVGSIQDRRGANCILYRTPLAEVTNRFEALYFCDGPAFPGEGAYAASLFPGVQQYMAAATPQLKDMQRELWLSLDQLREAYVQLRDQGRLSQGWPRARQQAALMVLQELALIRLEGSQVRMLPSRKCDPMDSPLFRLINGGRESGSQQV